MTAEFETMDGMVQLVLHEDALRRILRQFPLLDTHRLPAAEDDIPTYSLAPAQPEHPAGAAPETQRTEQEIGGVTAALLAAADAASDTLTATLEIAGPAERAEVVRAAVREFTTELLAEYGNALSAEARSLREKYSASNLVGADGIRYTNCVISAPTALSDARTLRSLIDEA